MDNMMKRIGVLTMHCVPNYGAIWQALATIILITDIYEDKYGKGSVKVELIDYQPRNKKKCYSDTALLLDSISSPRRFVGNCRRFEEKPILAKISQKYHVVYFAKESDSLLEYALMNTPKDVALVLIGMPGEIPEISECVDSVLKIEALRPGEFLTVIDNAEKVFTNSFHGIAFSLVFNKQVRIEYNDKKSKSNSRLQSVVKQFHLEKCVIKDDQSVANAFDGSEESRIDYSRVNEILDRERERNRMYLSDISSVIHGGYRLLVLNLQFFDMCCLPSLARRAA